MHKHMCLVGAVVLGLAGLLQAEPLQPKQISAEAKWVVHFDVDAMRTTIFALKAAEKVRQHFPDAEWHLDRVRAEWMFDPCTDIHGMTFYGDRLVPDTGVVLVHVNIDQKVLLEKAKQAPDYRVSKYGNYDLHTWTHAKGSKHQRDITGAFFGRDLIVFGGSTAEVMAALDVLDGTKPNLTAKSSPLAAPVPPGATFVARVVGLADAKLPCKSPVVKQLDAVSLALGESQGESFFAAEMRVKKAELAEQMRIAAEGLRAMAMIAAADDQQAQEMIKALKISSSTDMVGAEWRFSAEELWNRMEKECERMKEKGWPHHKPFWFQPKR